MLVAAVAPTFVQAQAPQASDSIDASVWQRAARNYWHVRLIVAHGDTMEGRVYYYRQQASIANSKVPESYLRLERRLSRGRGMYVGAGVGALAGALVIGGLAASLGEPGDRTPYLAMLGGAGAGATVGMVVGHLAVPAQHEWTQIWP